MSESVDNQLARLFPSRGGPYCPRGHAFDEANTKYTALGYRYCAACKRIQTHQARLRRAGLPPDDYDGHYRYRSWRRV